MPDPVHGKLTETEDVVFEQGRELTRLRADLQQADAAFVNHESRIAVLVADLQQAQNENGRLVARNDVLRAEVEELKLLKLEAWNLKAALEIDLQQAREQIDIAQQSEKEWRELAKSQSVIDKLADTITGLTAERDRLQRAVNEMRAEVAKLPVAFALMTIRKWVDAGLDQAEGNHPQFRRFSSVPASDIAGNVWLQAQAALSHLNAALAQLDQALGKET